MEKKTYTSTCTGFKYDLKRGGELIAPDIFAHVKDNDERVTMIFALLRDLNE